MPNKIIPFNVAIKSTATRRSYDIPKAYTNDLNSVEFQFTITDMTAEELTTAKANVLLYMLDGSFFENNEESGVTIEGNVVTYTMKSNEGNHSGVNEAQVEIIYEGAPDKKLASQKYEFEIINGLDMEVAVEIVVKDWSALTTEARKFIDDSTVEVNALKTELQNSIETANTSLGEFDVALQNGIIGENIAAELQNLEETYAPDLFTVKQQLEQTQADLQAGIGALTVDAEVVTARNSAVKGKTFAVLDDRFEDVEADVSIMGTNKIINGDFGNGTTGWAGISSGVTVANNILSNTSNGTTKLPYAYQVLSTKGFSGEKYYMVARVKVTNASCTALAVRLYDAHSVLVGEKTLSQPTSGVQYAISVVVPIAVNTANNMNMIITHYYPDTTTALDKVMEIQYVFAINLTATFGAGNEPTAAQMDRLLTQFPNSWFNGTENLFLAKWALSELRRLDNEKVNKVQEAWITPTLTNGWVVDDGYTVGYYKDEFGNVKIKGRVKSGSLSVPILTLPLAYRPAQTMWFPCICGGVVLGNISINTSGAVTLWSGNNTYTTLDTINFRV